MAGIVAPDDRRRPAAGAAHEPAHLGTGVTIIGDDALEDGTAPVLPSRRFGAIAVSDVDGVNIDARRQARCVDGDAALVAETLPSPLAS